MKYGVNYYAVKLPCKTTIFLFGFCINTKYVIYKLWTWHFVILISPNHFDYAALNISSDYVEHEHDIFFSFTAIFLYHSCFSFSFLERNQQNDRVSKIRNAGTQEKKHIFVSLGVELLVYIFIGFVWRSSVPTDEQKMLRRLDIVMGLF